MWGCNNLSSSLERGLNRSPGRPRQSVRPHTGQGRDSEAGGGTVRLDRLTGTVDSVGGEIDGVNGRVLRLREEKAALQRRLEGLSRTRVDQEGTLAKLSGEKSEWSQRETRLRDDCAQLVCMLEASNRRAEQAEEQRRLLQEQVDQLVCERTEEFRDAARQLQELNRLMLMGDEVQEFVAEQQRQLLELQQPSDQLRQEEDKMLQHRADSDSVDSVLDEMAENISENTKAGAAAGIGTIMPLRVGVRVRPVTLSLRYRTAEGAERLRLMPLRGLNAYGPVALPLAQLRQRHRLYLEQVPDIRLEKLLRLLQEVSCGRPLQEAAEALGREYSVDPQQDLNKLSEAELDKKKKIMDLSFNQNQIFPGNPDYVYDKRVEFGSESIEAAGWDSGEDFWE